MDYRGEFIVSVFSRVIDLENFHKVIETVDKEGSISIAHRLGWLNILNLEHFDRHYDLDLTFKDHWKLANMVTRLAVDEDGDNLPLRQFSRKADPLVWIPGWDLPASWDADNYQAKGTTIKPGVPNEGRLICQYWSKPNREGTSYFFALPELRARLGRENTLLGVPLEPHLPALLTATLPAFENNNQEEVDQEALSKVNSAVAAAFVAAGNS